MMIAQILIAIVITTILSSAFIKNNLNRDAQVKKTIAEIQLITEAAQKYQLDNSTWVDEANACINAISVLSAAPNAYLISVDRVSPFNTNYITSCTTTHFSIEVKTTELYAGYIKHQGELPAIIKPAPNTDTTITTIPKALADTVHDKFLALGDTLTTNTKYQGKSLEIEDVFDITLSDGRKLSGAFSKIYTIDMNATPREFVPKPTCTTPQITKIHLATVSVFAGNNKPIFGFLPTIDIANSNAVRWAITMNIETEDGNTTVGANTFVKATTYCE